MTGNEKVILVVEDNELMLNAIVRVFENSGFHVLTAPSLAGARSHLTRIIPDAVVLDILLPDGNGLDFISEIRELTTIPVLLVTSLGSKDERLAGLRAGGDDYITKPFDLDELVARVEAFLRREDMSRNQTVREIVKGPLKLDPVSARAYLYSEDILLTQKEFALLLLLVRNEGKMLSKEILFEKVWRQPVNEDARAIKAHLSNVRKKLRGSGYTINTSRGQGYCFKRSFE